MQTSKNVLYQHKFNWSQVQNIYNGKVRDVYDLGKHILMVVSDRISAFDYILPRAIPYKGEVLNQIALHFLESTRDICPNWLISNPDPNVSFGLMCEPIKLEMVVRGYLAGHAWRTYKSGERQLCGIKMPDGMKESQAFPEPIITPSTKVTEGHDEDISRKKILEKGIVDKKVYEQLEEYASALFKRGSEMANDKGLILVDTKYEFGYYQGEIYLIDEIHTPDSSRYYILDGYEERLLKEQKQKQLSKEFVREWLMKNGFQGQEGQLIPTMPDTFIEEVSERYLLLYKTLTGKSLDISKNSNIVKRIDENVTHFLNQL